ncbi:glycosyltransferase family 4 protein [Priestia megaterium]|uniref:glycosyltransferase family 4 protein n=1 Tax=Priestia megaterium TaxID=1404 RepID=UPI002B24A0DC|nr:glycosyltransferase family 4 protein [Priestia megaterium]MEB2289973.1 glycosyltransferase family 4 protein [Priestia megaterium]
MKKRMLLVGPLPPPLHGESLALSSVVNSDKIKKDYDVEVVNTNRKVVNNAGKFAFKKIIKDVYIMMKIKMLTSSKKVDIFYISISQTKLGLIRDLIIIKIASKKSKFIVTHLHGNNLGATIDQMPKLFQNLQSESLSKVDVGIVLGESLINNYRDMVKEVKVIANGIDQSFITDEEFKKALALRENRKSFQILYLSNLIEDKGYHLLIQAAMNLLLNKGYSFNVVLAGDIYNQAQFDKIMQQVKDKELSGKIQFYGVVTGKEKKNLLLDSDIMILPTNYKIEGQPLSIVEGMAAGLPIISTNRGSIPDLVKDNGILLDLADIESIEEAIEKLILNKDNLINIGEKSRGYYLDNFTLDRHILNLKKVFDGEIEANEI